MTAPSIVENDVVLESPRPLSKSSLWKIQRDYFAERGIDAWRQGEVPHYVTSSPTIAENYAEIVYGFMQDLRRLGDWTEPLVICELGAGSGRFLYHFLRKLSALCAADANLPPKPFLYVATDIIEENLAFWDFHPLLQDFFAAGVLDIATFDVTTSDRFELRRSGRIIARGDLQHPLCVIANYVFDGVEHDMFRVENGRLYHSLVSLLTDAGSETADLSPSELFENVRCAYSDDPSPRLGYGREDLDGILDQYRTSAQRGYVLFPAAGLAGLAQLQAISRNGLLLLAADKGDHRLFTHDNPPGYAHHGSISFGVNFDAFERFCTAQGGLALFPSRPSTAIDVGALLFLENPEQYQTTINAYARYIDDFGPDDFYTILLHARGNQEKLSFAEIMAYLRLTRYDSHQFSRLMPRFRELVPELNESQRTCLSEAIERCWDRYFPLKEPLDIAFDIGNLLYAAADYQGAAKYFDRSAELYGAGNGTTYNLGLCAYMQGDLARAKELLTIVLRNEPDHDVVRRLLDELATA